MIRIFLNLLIVTILALSCSSKEDEKIQNDSQPYKQSVEIHAIISSQVLNKDQHPINLFDSNENTLWQVDNQNQGVGEYFEIQFSKDILFNRVVVVQTKSQSVNRIKELLLSYESKQEFGKAVLIANDKETPDILPTPKPVKANKVTIYIQSVYSKKEKLINQSALAELNFYYDDEKVKLTNLQQVKLNSENEDSKTKIPKGLKPLKSLSVTESSYKQNQGISFTGQSLIDGNLKTAWIEGQMDEGIGEFVQFEFPEKEFNLKGISILNGNQSDKNSFKKMNRVKNLAIDVSLETDKGSVTLWEKTILLKDTPDLQFQHLDYQIKKDNRKVKALLITVTIKSVYFGTTNKDSSLSEIVFYSGPTDYLQ